MGESNRSRWLFVPEVTWGVTPATPTMETLLRTGGSLQGNRNTTVSKAVQSDRMRRKLYSTGKDGKGSIEAELAYGQLDTIIEHLMASDWSAAITGTVSVTFDTTADTINRAAGSFVSDGWLAGMHLYVGPEAADAANEGYCRITAVTATDLSVDKNLTTNAVPATVTLRNDGMIRNGTTAKSLSIEQGHLDQSHFYLFAGMRAGQGSISMSANGLVTFNADFMGLYPTYAATTAASVITAVNTNDAYDTGADIDAIFEGGATCAETLTAFDLTFTNNLRNRPQLRSEAPSGIAYGVQDVTGSLSYYMGSSHTLANKVLNFTESSAYVRLQNLSSASLDKTLIVTLPQFKYSGGVPPEAGQLDGDVTMKMPFTAYSGGAAQQLQFDRITPAA
jgi:hypothetical protein